MELLRNAARLLLLLLIHSSGALLTQSAPDRGVVIDGDIFLGGLFPLNSPSCAENSGGRIETSGLKRLEAMIFSLKAANSNQSLLRYGRHKINLGGVLLDTCSNSVTATRQQLIELARSSFGGDFYCKASAWTDYRQPARRLHGGSVAPIRGVVGAAMSHVSAEAARLLQVLGIPQISYASSFSYLSNRNVYELFARTRPSGSEQVKVVLSILAHFNWTYVSVLYSDDSFGRDNIIEFEQLARMRNICIADRFPIGRRYRSSLDEDMERLVRSISTTRVVVLFTYRDDTRRVLDAMAKTGAQPGRIVYLSADGPVTSPKSVEDTSLAAIGALSIQLSDSGLPGFSEYFSALRPGQRDTGVAYVNRYFDTFWEQRFNCTFDTADGAVGGCGSPDGKQKKMCSESLSLGTEDLDQQGMKLQFVYDAVLTFAHGLDKVMKLVCPSQRPDFDTKASGLFDQCVKNIINFPAKQLYDILIAKNNSFVNIAGHIVEFTPNGNGIVKYLVYNYQGRSNGTGQRHNPVVGEWHPSTGLSWRTDQPMVWPGGTSGPPQSVCSEECGPGQRKLYPSTGEKCCWICMLKDGD